MHFKDIPRYTTSGHYQVNCSWNEFEEQFILPTKREIILDLDPDYQRDYVWTEEQEIKYIEHILRGGIQGKDIWLNCPGWMKNYRGPFEVVDGKQRIKAVLDFIHNKIPVFGNNYYKDFDRLPIGYGDFLVHVNDLPTRKQVLQWYIEMNEGGTVHTKAEIDKVKELLKKEK